jgi:hypothetical protein
MPIWFNSVNYSRIPFRFPLSTRPRSQPLHSMNKAPICVLLASTCLLTVSVAKWSRIPGVDNKPVNMCLSVAGTTVASSSGINPSSGLTVGDPLRSINIAAGKSEAILKFTVQSYVDKASFVSDGLEGKVSASMSADGKAWNAPTSTVFSPADRNVALDMGRAPGRYLRLEFELVRGGTIRSFQAFGAYTEADFKLTEAPDNDGPAINLASGISGGRLIYVNPESYGDRNDATLFNQIDFPESDEKFRTAVYDLGQVRSLSEFGSVHSPRPVRLSVYAFESLPEKEDWRGRLAFDSTVFDTAEPVASGEEAAGSGTIKVKPKSVVKARYVALRWEPDFNPPNFVASVSLTTNGYNVTFTPPGGGAPGQGGAGGGQGGTDGTDGTGGGGQGGSPFMSNSLSNAGTGFAASGNSVSGKP